MVVADAPSGEGSEVFTSEIGYGSRFSGFGGSGYSGFGGSNNVVWLADDTLLFPSEKTGWRLLYAVPADGGAARLVTPGAFEIEGAAPIPDRSGVFYWANSAKDHDRLGLYRLTLAGGLRPERFELERLAHSSSAISKIDEWGNEPILFIHGDNDSSAAMKQSLELYLALKRRGKTAEASIFPGEAHGFKTAANNEKMIRVIVDFLEKYNRGD